MGQDAPENLILRSTKRLAEDAEDIKNSELIGLHQVFCQMVSERYLEKCPDINTLTRCRNTIPSYSNSRLATGKK